MASRHPTPKCISGDFEVADAVVVVAHHRANGKMVLIKEYRVPLGGYQYSFPAGLIDTGETLAQAAKREFHEETGLKLEKIVQISQPIYSSAGMSDESVCMVHGECDGTPSAKGNEGTEDIAVVMVSPAEAKALIEDPKAKFDAKAWLVLSAYSRDLKLEI